MKLIDLLKISHGLVKVYYDNKSYYLLIDSNNKDSLVTDCSDVKHLFNHEIKKILPLGNEWSHFIRVNLK